MAILQKKLIIFFLLFATSLAEAAKPTPFTGCKTGPVNSKGELTWCCKNVDASYFPLSKCKFGFMVAHEEQQCSLSKTRKLMGTTWVCEKLDYSEYESSTGPRPKPRSSAGETEIIPTLTPVPLTTTRLSLSQQTLSKIQAQVDTAFSLGPADLPDTVETGTRTVQLMTPYALEASIRNFGPDTNEAQRLIEDIRTNPRFIPILTDKVTLGTWGSAVYVSNSDPISNISIGTFANFEQFKQRIAMLTKALEERAKPKCRDDRLNGDISTLIREVLACNAKSIDKFSDQTTMKLYSEERYLALVLLLDKLGATDGSIAPLKLLNQWHYFINWGISASLSQFYEQRLQDLLSSGTKSYPLIEQVLIGVSLLNIAGDELDHLTNFILNNQDDDTFRPLAYKAIQAVLRAASWNPKSFQTPSAAEQLLKIATLLQNQKDTSQLPLIVKSFSALSKPIDSGILNFTRALAEQDELYLARLEAIKFLESNKISSNNGTPFTLAAEKTRFMAAHLGERIEKSKRYYITGFNLLSDRQAVATEAKKAGIQLSEEQFSAKVRARGMARIERLEQTFEDEEKAFVKIFGFTEIPDHSKLRIILINDPTDYQIILNGFTENGVLSYSSGFFSPQEHDLFSESAPTTYLPDMDMSYMSKDGRTLENNAIHEFGHYLEYKYFAEQSTNILKWNSLPQWWLEGVATFMVGFQPDGTVIPWKTSLKEISMDQSYMHLNQLFQSKNDSDTSEYRYGSLFYNFLYSRKHDLFVGLNNLLVQGKYHYQGLNSNFLTDLGYSVEAVDAEYQRFLEEQVVTYKARQN